MLPDLWTIGHFTATTLLGHLLVLLPSILILLLLQPILECSNYLAP